VQSFFLSESGAHSRETQAAKYDAWLGRPEPAQEAAMHAGWKAIDSHQSYADVDAWLATFCPPRPPSPPGTYMLRRRRRVYSRVSTATE
jgi:hypothetical protein